MTRQIVVGGVPIGGGAPVVIQSMLNTKTTDVVGVKIGDQPGKLSMALDVLDKADINMEYLYAFMARTEKHAYVVLRVADNAQAEKVLEDAGFHMITDADVEKL